MNYDDELERAKAKRSRKRTSETAAATRATAANHANQTVQSANSARATYRRRKKKNKARKIILIVVLVLFAVIAAAGFGIYKYFDNKVESMDQVDFKVPEVQNLNLTEEKREQMEKGFLTVAVFGVDSRDNSLGKGNQSDVIMIANLNRETGEIKLVSVFRDTYLNVSDKNTYNKINAAYASGGPEAAVKAINKNLDLNITHYATFNWKAVATVINILGGVEVDISKSEFYYINAFITETVKGTGIGSVQLKAPGVHNLDGVQAVAYGRLRLMDSDYARTERQRIILTKAFEKLKKADLTTLNSVVGHVMEMSSTNIKWEELLSLAGGISKYHLSETTGFPAARGEAKIKIGSNKLSCVIPQTLESNVISLHNFLFGEENYEPSATVKEISAKIAHVSGLATEAEEIGSVAVDQGYIPKPTTTAAAPAETKKESEAGKTEETSATETAEASDEGEFESTAEGESESTSEGESESETAAPLWPGINNGPGMGPGSSTEATTEVLRPGGPASAVKPTESKGPGSAPEVPEATTSAGPGGVTNSDNQTSATIAPTKPESSTVKPSASAPGTTKPSAVVPSSPADITISGGGPSGPASQATSAAAPGM
ncbi:MAG: LCP family protein [Lachnospiraceae bacterium]|nr:LCP family protein [Lachnospiraceae bacterium]